MTAREFKPTTTLFINKQSTIYPNWPNDDTDIEDNLENDVLSNFETFDRDEEILTTQIIKLSTATKRKLPMKFKTVI